ncbi:MULTISPECIES: ATP-binding protein [Pseudacidovorax]|uniref:ATP-binding protein n=1 Tax=Pseudacidovorax TaxID=433923 RepID=UPI001F2F4809|nr:MULTISPECIES: ATP-binding protein [Pseudacidovorax]
MTIWRRSLSRRIFLVVLLSFVLVLAVLQAYMWLSFRQSLAVSQPLSRLGGGLGEALAAIDDEAQAVATVQAMQTVYGHLRLGGNPTGTLVFRLEDREGRLLFSAPQLRDRALAAPPGRVGTMDMEGVPYWVYRADTGRWRVYAAEPERTLALVVPNNTRAVLPYLLIALPLVLVPAWLAVALGLRPLRQLTQRLQRRSPDDLTPLGFRARHAELQPLAEALDGLLMKLKARIDRERAFVQDAAHELRTPMAVIATQAHALGGAADAGQRREAQQQLEAAIARASHLTQQLLDLARLDDAPPAVPATLDVAQWLRQVMADMAPAALARDMDLSLVAPDQLMATVEPAALLSIVQNLLANATGHTPPGTRIVVTLANSPHPLCISVEDDGPGIPDEASGQVFERFHRGADPLTRGAGLGLAIVRQAAQRLGGEVRLAPGLEGRGAGFHVRLP